MDELPQKTSRWTPTVIFTLVLLLTSILLYLRLVLRTAPIGLKAHPETFPQTLLLVAFVMIGLKQLETKGNRGVGIVLLVAWVIMFIFAIAGYLVIS